MWTCVSLPLTSLLRGRFPVLLSSEADLCEHDVYTMRQGPNPPPTVIAMNFANASPALVLVLSIILLLFPIFFILVRIRHHWTTLGILSSEWEYLNQLSARLDQIDGFQKRHQSLSDDSRERLTELCRTQVRYALPQYSEPLGLDIDTSRRCLTLVHDLGSRCLSGWFVFWRSAKFRKDLVNVRRDIKRFTADMDESILSKKNVRIS